MSACGLGRVNVITSRGLSEILETFCHYCTAKTSVEGGGQKKQDFFARDRPDQPVDWRVTDLS